MTEVRLVGLDFGTTTSNCVVASATLMHNVVSGRRELTGLREDYRSELVFTPFCENGLDLVRLQQYIEVWLAAGKVRPGDIFGGGALLTGLAARKRNSAALVDLVRSRLESALIATADDPCLEAWLSFQASVSRLSRSQPDRCVVNLDVGGGTTNIALGKNGDVVCTGSLFVGARHVQFVPGTYRVVALSEFARRQFEHLGIARGVGDCLDGAEVEVILDFYLDLIESALAGDRTAFERPIARLHQQAPFEPPPDVGDTIVTLSGGVGELVYDCRHGRTLPSTTFYGDLGIDLARRFLGSPRWAARLEVFEPACSGRATVYGLLLHATKASGNTLFLPDPGVLPLEGLPIFGRVTANSTEGKLRDILQLVERSPRGGAVLVTSCNRSARAVSALGDMIANALASIVFPRERPLVLLVEENIGKALGQYVTRFGSNPFKLMVLDEIEIRDARFVHIGEMQDQVVPVSFYGMN